MKGRVTSMLPGGISKEPGQPEVVLVVEDDRSSRELLCELLSDEGYCVVAAQGAWEALDAVEHSLPDLVISDVCMADGDGLTLLRALRGGRHGTFRRTPVIMVSAHHTTDRRVDALDLGADDFVAKPIELEELLARVRSHLRRSRRESELATRSYLDELTGLPNRRALLQFYDYERRQAEQSGREIGVALADLNEFKRLNDTHGHDVGDAALRAVAGFLLDNVRATDCVARLGGDEFAIVLCSDDGGALSLVERLRARLPLHIDLDGAGQVDLRLALGATLATPAESLEVVLKRADTLMYRDKPSSRPR